jgi:hypothetical protein
MASRASKDVLIPFAGFFLIACGLQMVFNTQPSQDPVWFVITSLCLAAGGAFLWLNRRAPR